MTEEENFAMRVDSKTTLKVTYIGWAPRGSLTSDPVWRIKVIDDTETVNPVTITRWPDGSDRFDFVWDDRAILSYI